MSEPSPSLWAKVRPWLVQLALPLAVGALFLGSVLLLGRLAGDWLGPSPPDWVSFADIECEAPPGLTREGFLAEVQYLAELPDALDARHEDTRGRVREAFLKHPWVRDVGGVELHRGEGKADLIFRVPVLYVPAWQRAVDAEGALLPQSAGREGLFVLVGTWPVPAGRVADEERARCAVSVAALLYPHRQRLGLIGAELNVTEAETTISGENCRILWGRRPGHEHKDEPPAAEKLRRLLAEEGLTGHQWDARPADALVRQPLP